MKRNYLVLSRRLRVLIARPVSPADRPGRIYHFSDNPFEYKVGRAINVKRRRRQWRRSCPDPNRIWYESIWAPHSHRAGKFHSVVNIL